MSYCVQPVITYHGSNVTILDPETGEILWEIYDKQPTLLDDGTGTYIGNDPRARSIRSSIVFLSTGMDDSIEDNPMNNDDIQDGEWIYPRKIFNSQPTKFDNPYEYDAFSKHTSTKWGAWTKDYFFRIITSFPNDDLTPVYTVEFYSIEGDVIGSYLLPSGWYQGIDDYFSTDGVILGETDNNVVKQFGQDATLIGNRSIFVSDFLIRYISWQNYFYKLTKDGVKFYCLGESSGANFDNTSVFFDSEIQENGFTYQLDNGPFGASQASIVYPICFNGDEIIYLVGLYYENFSATPQNVYKVKLASFSFDESFSDFDSFETYLKDNFYGEELRFDPQRSWSFGTLNWIVDTDFEDLSLGALGSLAYIRRNNGWRRVVSSTIYKNSDNFVFVLASDDNTGTSIPIYGNVVNMIGYDFSGQKIFDVTHRLGSDEEYVTINYANLTTDKYLFIQEETRVPNSYNPRLNAYDMYTGNLVQSFPYYVNLSETLDSDLANQIDQDIQIDGVPRFDSSDNFPYFKDDKLFYNAIYYDNEEDNYYYGLRACQMDGTELWHSKYLFCFLTIFSRSLYRINMEGMYTSHLSNCRIDDNGYLVIIHPSYFVRPGSNHTKLKQDLELYSYHGYLLDPNKDNTPSSLFGGSLF